jgi:predicted MFS family arabinose efflux permease
LRYRSSLDALNFFLADVRGGLGVFVTVFLVTEASWSPAAVGAVLTVSGLIGITLHAPIGALIDVTRAKRALLISGVALLAVCSVAVERFPTGPVVLTADIIMAVLGAVFAPTVAAITLGLVSLAEFPARLARNTAFDRFGNVFVTALVGAIAWWFSQRAVFYLIPVFAFLCALTVLSIPARAIDHDRARGFVVHDVAARPEGWWALLFNHRSLQVLAAIAVIFHFANASMLPLAGQKLALAHPGLEATLVSACILVGQLATIPVAIFTGRVVDEWGRKPLLVIACGALVFRALIFASFDNALVIIAAQVLDGVSAGILDILVPLMLADILRGTGRYNVGRGILGTVQGVGGSLSGVAGGMLVVTTGYTFAFAALAAVASGALLLTMRGFSETHRGTSA